MKQPEIEWVFGVRSPRINKRTFEGRVAPIDADVLKLRQQFLDAGYDCVYLAGKRWEKWAWPGGYPMFLVMKDSGILCIDCANERWIRQLITDPEQEDPQWTVAMQGINYENDYLICDHCGKYVESAYGEPDGETT